MSNDLSNMDSVPALQRGLALLEAVARQPGQTATQLQVALGIPKASCTRLLSCLRANGSVRLNALTHGFELGDALTALVLESYRREPVVVASRALLERLARQWQVTFVVYEYREPFEVVWRAKAEPVGAIQTLEPGSTTQKLNINAQGKWFLAQLPEARVLEYLAAGLAAQATCFSTVSAAELLAQLAVIRAQGYATQQRENHIAMQQIAVPLTVRHLDRILALGCHLPMEFAELDGLREMMQLEAARMGRLE